MYTSNLALGFIVTICGINFKKYNNTYMGNHGTEKNSPPSVVQELVYKIAKEVGINPEITPLLKLEIENSYLTIVYVETNGVVYKLKTEYPHPKTGVS